MSPARPNRLPSVSRLGREALEDAYPRPGSTLPLLVEVGCEEIPARFLADAQRDFANRLHAALTGARLLPERGTAEAIQSYSTPRRLVAYVPHVLKKQTDRVEQVLGPPIKVAFDTQGIPTRAAESFAAKNGVQVEALTRVTTAKGQYLAVRRTTVGGAAYDVLREMLPGVITCLAFPKSMVWTAKSGPRFVRPIRWLLALLGEGRRARIVPFEIAGVVSGCWTYRHRQVGIHRMRVRSFADYAEKLREGLVEFNPERRRETVREEVKALLQDSGLIVVEDKTLEDWIVASTEWPRAILGHFEDRFLKLPREILVTVMRDHQKYFAVEDQSGNLQPRFITVLNVEGDPRGVIRAGHERVLAARFTDAEFFWKADQKVPLEKRFELLKRVTYHEKFGSYADKVRRMLVLAEDICDQLQAAQLLDEAKRAYVLQAIRLCKCDLTTQMVQEFPELQGVVGGLYARQQGEPQEVAHAIYDHYLPVNVEGGCPRGTAGAIASLADKMDSVVAGFGSGLIPTGSSDPFAVRRAGNGIVKLILEFSEFTVDLEPLQKRAVHDPLWDHIADMDPVKLEHALDAFFVERTEHYLRASGRYDIRYDTQRAVLGAGWRGSLNFLRRCLAVERVRAGEDFEALCAGAKRIRNILTKSATGDDWSPGEVEEPKLEPGPETELYRAYRTVAGEAGRLSVSGDYAGALRAISTLRPAVDRFFDQVLVMAEAKAVRANRLRLLGQLNQLFTSIADLSQIESTTLSRVDAPTSPIAVRDP